MESHAVRVVGLDLVTVGLVVAFGVFVINLIILLLLLLIIIIILLLFLFFISSR